MMHISLPGVVVYAVVETSKGQMLNVRLETQGDGKPPIERVFGSGSLTRARFNQLLKTAHQPLATNARMELRNSLMPADASIDAGKRVFFKDVDFYGLLPKALGIKNGITIGSKTVQEALANRRSIEGVRLDPQKFAGFMGYPENETDLADVFGKQKTAALTTWQQHAGTLRTMAEKFGVRLFSGTDFRKPEGRSDFLTALENAEGIFFIVAHAEGCHFSIPGSTDAIRITPADIAQLHLSKSPIVILRICDGIDNGYASAFMKAGARSVWANRGVISAKAANEQIELFMKFSSEGDSVQEAIRRVEELVPTANNAAGLFAQLFTPRFGR